MRLRVHIFVVVNIQSCDIHSPTLKNGTSPRGRTCRGGIHIRRKTLNDKAIVTGREEC